MLYILPFDDFLLEFGSVLKVWYILHVLAIGSGREEVNKFKYFIG
jgi:hypothetical protein